MFDVVRNNPKISQLVVSLLLLPFAFFGVQSYFTSSSGKVSVATVADSPISVQEFENALRSQQDSVRQRLGDKADANILSSPGFKKEVLQRLINQRILRQYVIENRFMITDARLQNEISAIPAFQEDGKFSMQAYERAVATQGMGQRQFEEGVRRDMALGQLIDGVSTSGVAPRATAKKLLGLQEEQRTVQYVDFLPEKYLANLDANKEELKSAYEADKASFARPARVKAEFIVFSKNALIDQVKVSDEELHAWYDDEKNKSRYTLPEERKARHILIQLNRDATDAEVATATKKAEDLLAKVKAHPESFSDIAKKNSDDPGSAASGGDLGFFAKGAMVKEFEDEAFRLKEGDVSGLVRSDFGIHIIKLDKVREGKTKSFEEVSKEILASLKQDKALKLFNAQAENFSNLVFEQSDSLQPAANRFGLKLAVSDWVTKGADEIGGIKDKRIIDALFSDEVLHSGRNSQAIEIGRDELVAVRVKDHEEARVLAIDEVSDQVKERVLKSKALGLAQAEGAQLLAELQSNEKQPSVKWTQAADLKRGSRGYSSAELKTIFSKTISELPQYVGVVRGDGTYRIYKILSDKPVEVVSNDERLKAIVPQYDKLVGEYDFLAFLESLKIRYSVSVNEKYFADNQSN